MGIWKEAPVAGAGERQSMANPSTPSLLCTTLRPPETTAITAIKWTRP